MTTSILDAKTKSGVQFGKELREKDFMFDEGYLNLNHGSFGTYPRPVRDQMRFYQDKAEARPDSFIRFQYPPLLYKSREALATLLKVPTETTVLIPNATTGINIVLRGLTYQPGDHILYFNPVYGACEKTVLYITETTPAELAKVDYTYPVEDDWLVEEFKKKVQKVKSSGGRVKIAMFDTIVSAPGVRFPFERITAACKEEGVLSLIDGAHGIGQIDLDLGKLDPDFCVSNCHKWLHVPRGCSVFYVPVRNQHFVRSTLPTSHGFNPIGVKINSPFPKSSHTDFVANFEFAGTMDASPYLCIPTALEWREELGGEEVVRNYCTTLVDLAGKHVAGVLGTEVLDNETRTMSRCAMANIRLPISVAKVQETASRSGLGQGEMRLLVRDWIGETAIDGYGTFIQIYFYGGAWWARLSGQVYLDMQDFEWAAQTLKTICERVEKGEWAAARNY